MYRFIKQRSMLSSHKHCLEALKFTLPLFELYSLQICITETEATFRIRKICDFFRNQWNKVFHKNNNSKKQPESNAGILDPVVQEISRRQTDSSVFTYQTSYAGENRETDYHIRNPHSQTSIITNQF